MTQGERILNYIDRFGSISPMEAFRDLGITKLATRISELKRDGYQFEQSYEKVNNRFGEPVMYMRYSRKEVAHGGEENVC